jgi:hypothetical protein
MSTGQTIIALKVPFLNGKHLPENIKARGGRTGKTGWLALIMRW